MYKIIRQIVLWVVAYTILLTLFLMPTTVEFDQAIKFHYTAVAYKYSIQEHLTAFKIFFTYLIDNKGLGHEVNGDSIFMTIVEKVFRSLKLVIPALLIGFFVGMAKGVFDYRTRNTKGRFAGKGATWLTLSVPDMFLVLLIQFGLLILMSKGLLFHIDLFGHDKIDNVLLCILFLSIYPTAYIANITFRALRDEEGLDYIRTAKSKGIAKSTILFKHMLKNGLGKILSHSNTMVLYLLSNLFIIEIFTEYRGAAFYFRNALGNPSMFVIGRDVLGTDAIYAAGYAFFFTIIVLIANVIAEMAKKLVTPVKGGVEE